MQGSELNPVALYADWLKNKTDSSLSAQIVDSIENFGLQNLESVTDFMISFLNETSCPEFLTSLPDASYRNKWAEICFLFIRETGYDLLGLFESRLKKHPSKPLFIEVVKNNSNVISFERVNERTRQIAASFYKLEKKPVVCIMAENSPETAMTDLACLFYDIPVSPLNVFFTENELSGIFSRLCPNIFVTDSIERLLLAKKAFAKSDQQPVFILSNSEIKIPDDFTDKIYFLGEISNNINQTEINEILKDRYRRTTDSVATVMFTSGSTGQPKGVSFSQYNLVTKRFARSAALPFVGSNETLLCFLPLYHTFGRFLEMLGMIYWSGTYVFAGNSSSDTLLSLFPRISPSGFISVPLRWEQLYEHCLKQMEQADSDENKKIIFRSVVGDNLNWGLSAAGYLNPKIFRFFSHYGVELCSGFGMTEGTGGLTMTPPHEYRESSIGVPLPGTYTRLSEIGELQVSGHYIADYFDNTGLYGKIEYFDVNTNKRWLSTGDIFQADENGFYEIVDRIKDIYKNSKGQTIAPQTVEKKFAGIPGFKRTFLVGDGRLYNVLLIVPDEDDAIIRKMSDKDNLRKYYSNIVSNVNTELAPYERVINFGISDRDFSADMQELTPKGSYNRKIILQNFSEVIQSLYKSTFITIETEKLHFDIPLWFYRNLGILEDDILFENNYLINTKTGNRLEIRRFNDGEDLLLGDLIYKSREIEINLGAFANQPRLWMANPALMRFAPCNEGWDDKTNFELSTVQLPENRNFIYDEKLIPSPAKCRSKQLIEINRYLTIALFGENQVSSLALEQIQDLLSQSDSRTASVIRMRLGALANHPEESVRCKAYRILLLDEPHKTLTAIFPQFLYSGLRFINLESIEIIAKSRFEYQRLSALRQRLFDYRRELIFPLRDNIREQIINIFRLLTDFTESNPEFYGSVRAELVSWLLLFDDHELSLEANFYFGKLSSAYEKNLQELTPGSVSGFLEERIIFDSEIEPEEKNSLKKILSDKIFIKQSVILAFDEINFNLNSIVSRGIFVSRIDDFSAMRRYRISVNTEDSKHYDLELQLYDELNEFRSIKTALWHIAIAGYAVGSAVLPQTGSVRPDLHAATIAYVGELSVWDRIRAIGSIRSSGGTRKTPGDWRNMYTKAIASYFTAWRNSGYKIIPGLLSPSNVHVPENDFYDKSTIFSLKGWKPFDGIQSILQPLIDNFYLKPLAQYPWIEDRIDIKWLMDSIVEALGELRGFEVLSEILSSHCLDELTCNDNSLFRDKIKSYISHHRKSKYRPLALYNAINRYKIWIEMNPDADRAAKYELVRELLVLYKLDKFDEYIRFYLYRQTYFENIPDINAEIFDTLLEKLEVKSGKTALEMPLLADLKQSLTDATDIKTFNKMVFPNYTTSLPPEILKVKKKNDEFVLITSYIKDKNNRIYSVREPLNTQEVGELYRLFFKDDFPHQITENDNYLLVIDSQENVIGGLSYQYLESDEVQLDGTAVTTSLKGRGIGRALIDDFFKRMKNNGINAVRTFFLLRQFYLGCGFRTDKRYGELVKFL